MAILRFVQNDRRRQNDKRGQDEAQAEGSLGTCVPREDKKECVPRDDRVGEDGKFKDIRDLEMTP